MQNEAVLDNWKRLRGEILSTWGLLTEEELDGIDGRRDRLVNLLADRYGLGRSRAEQEVDRLVNVFEAKLKRTA